MSRSGMIPALVSSDEIIQLAYECRRRLRQNRNHRPTLPHFLLYPTYHSILLSYLNRRASFHRNRSTAVSEYVDSLLFLSKFEGSLTSLLPSLLQSYASLFTSGQIPHDSHSSSSLQFFSTHLDSMPALDLVPIVVSIITYLPHISETEDTGILILLPKCLNLIDSFERMHNRDEYTNSVLDKMLRSDWCKALCVKMLEIIQDFEYLDKTRRSEFLAKVFVVMKDVDVLDIPWLVYQLLGLTSKGFDRKDVIEGILMFFGCEEMNAKGGLMMRHVEGTALLQINSAVKKDLGLAREVLRLVMFGYSRAFNHFTIGVLFSIARIGWLNVFAIWILKSTLFVLYKGYKFAKECKWLADHLKEDYFLHARAIEKAVLRAVKESSFGREHVLSSIVKLGFGLLEGVEEIGSEEIKDDCIAGPVELGFEVLKSLFDLHDGVRNEIIQQCNLKIRSSKPGVMQIIRLLGHLVQNHPRPLLQRASHLKELLDNFTFSDSEKSSSLINVLWPLIKCSRDLQDHTILALQEATFRQESSVHVSAAAAIVELILAEKRSEKTGSVSLQKSSSEACNSQKTEVYHITGAGLFQELSGLLRRCLSQQASVREIVYHGLLKMVLIDPLVAESVLNFILPHFQRFLTKDAELLEIINCIKIENGEFYIEEPFDCLLSCISWIVQQFHQHASNPSNSSDLPGFSITQENEAGRTLATQSLSNGLLKIWDLVKTESISGIIEDLEARHTLEPGQVPMCCLLFLGIIEVNLNTTFFELEKATDIEEVELVKELSRLVCLYECAEEEASEYMQKTAAKRGLMRSLGNYGSDKLYSSCTNLQERSPRLKTSYIHQLLQSAIKQINGGLQDLLSDDGVPVLQGTLSFVLKICMRQLDFISLGKDDPLKTMQGNIYSLASPLLEVILLLKKTREKSEIGEREKDIMGRNDICGHRENILLALVCLKKLITLSLCSSDYAVMLNDLLSVARNEAASLNVSDTSWDTHDNIPDSLDPGMSKELFIVKIAKPLLEEFLGLSYFQEAEVISNIVQMIADTMVGGTKNLIGEWATSMCRSTSITDPKVARSMLRLSVSLTSAPNDMLVVQDMATHLLQVVGSEKAAPLDTSEAYPIINKSTSAGIATSILGLIELFTIEMQYVIRKLKGSIAAQNEDPTVLALEESSYTRAEAALLVLSSFVQMDLQYPQFEQFLKVTVKFFKCLDAILKLLSAPRDINNQIQQSMKHEKLVRLTGYLLTDPLCLVISQKLATQAELYELQNYSDGAVTIPELVQRERKCIFELCTHAKKYEEDLVELCNDLLRKLEHFKGSGGEVEGGNDAVLSREANTAETAAAEDPSSRNGDCVHLPPEKRRKLV